MLAPLPPHSHLQREALFPQMKSETLLVRLNIIFMYHAWYYLLHYNCAQMHYCILRVDESCILCCFSQNQNIFLIETTKSLLLSCGIKACLSQAHKLTSLHKKMSFLNFDFLWSQTLLSSFIHTLHSALHFVIWPFHLPTMFLSSTILLTWLVTLDYLIQGVCPSWFSIRLGYLIIFSIRKHSPDFFDSRFSYF